MRRFGTLRSRKLTGSVPEAVQGFLNHHDPVYFELLKPTEDKEKLLIKVGNNHILPINFEKVTLISANGELSEYQIDKLIQPRDLKIFDQNFLPTILEWKINHTNRFKEVCTKKKFFVFKVST